jgi:hypothetical protein
MSVKFGKIDLTKIDKSRLFVSEKTGSKYLDIVVFDTPESEYADYMIVESITKEEREAGKKGTILGNLKELSDESGDKGGEDDLPF